MPDTGHVGAVGLDRLFILICKALPDEARDLASGLPAEHRAQAALFCYGRTDLREVGRAIAGACDEMSLVQEGGSAGAALYAQRTAAPERFATSRGDGEVDGRQGPLAVGRRNESVIAAG